MNRPRKIRFIEPGPRPGRPFNAWLTRWPLLGPITLATILDQRGYDVGVYNENISGPLLENPDAMVDVCSADVIGISIMTPTASRGYAIADHLRTVSDARIVFGGVHATFMPEEALTHGDVVVRGEAENVIEAVASGELREGIIRSEPPEDLDTLPTLNHHLMYDFNKLIKSRLRREFYELPVMASRGCPYGCNYCTVTQMFGRKVRRQSVEKVCKDLAVYEQRGFRRLFFYDDNFTSDREWTRQLLKKMTPQRFTFNAQVRADFYWHDAGRRQRDEDLLAAMRKAGADVLYIGFETIDDSTAAEWHKGYGGTGELKGRLMEDVRTLHKHGFWIHGMFVLGPQHTQQTIDQLINFGHKSGLESFQISVLTPFPGTPLMEQMRPHLILKQYPADWDYYDGTHCVFGHSRMGAENIQKALLAAHRRFYRWWSLWAWRCLRGQIVARTPFLHKITQLLSSTLMARRALRLWKLETHAFLEMLRSRMAAHYVKTAKPTN